MASAIELSNVESLWLQCKLDKGMFSDELAVTYPAEGTAQKSVFVGASSVQGIAGSLGLVQVRIIQKDGKTLAVLPSADQDIVYARPEDLTGK